MLAAFLTAALWSIGAVSANRGARLVGGLRFNLVRLLLALALLGAYGHSFGGGLAGPWVPWFLVSGVIGFGIGDLAGYSALAALGSRLAVLVIHCAAMPLGALLEWGWLGRPLASQAGWSVVIAAGLVVAMAPSLSDRAPQSAIADRRGRFGRGITMSLVAAVSQALGAVDEPQSVRARSQRRRARRSPLIVTPLSMLLEGERPSRRSLAGAMLSVGARAPSRPGADVDVL